MQSDFYYLKDSNCKGVNCTGDRDQDHPHGEEMQKSKMAIGRGLTNSCEKRGKKQGEKGTTEDEMAGWHHRLDGCQFE